MIDLFTPRFPEDRWHPNYRNALNLAPISSREIVSKWAEGFFDRDGKFVDEFQLSFNSSFWELYLYAVIKEYGYEIDWSNPSPDFSVVREKQSFSIEAVTANAADGKLNEWDVEYTEEGMKKLDIPSLNREAMIRLANAIHSKHKKYIKGYSNLHHVKGRPFVLAVAPFEQPFFNHQYNRPIRAVLYDHYVDEAEYLGNPGAFPNGPRSKKLGFITKDNGSDIELGLFNDDRLREISAVIFSCTATWGKADACVTGETEHKTVHSTVWGSDSDGRPIRRVGTPSEIGETVTDGLQIYHNPFALRPLNPNVFRRKGVVQEFFDVETQRWVIEELNRSLFSRWAFSVIPRGSGLDGAEKEA